MTQTEFLVLLPALTLAVAALVVLLADLFLPAERKQLTGWLTLIGFAAAGLSLTTWPAGMAKVLLFKLQDGAPVAGKAPAGWATPTQSRPRASIWKCFR